MNNSNKPLGFSLWWFILPSIILLLLIVVSPICFSIEGPDWMVLSTEDSARVGSAIGGITAPFVGVLAVVATFLAFWAQYEYNKRQLKFTIREQFDHSFYEMLGIHESITNALVLEIGNTSSAVLNNKVLQKNTEVRIGRDIFAYIYEDLLVYEDKINGQFNIPNKIQYIGLKGLFQANKNAYTIYAKNMSVRSLDHYFRQLYTIFKMIHENNDLTVKEKYNYARIVRSTLSQYELVMLFYNCLSENGKEKFKPLIEEFSVLKNIRKDLLADDAECEKYQHTAFSPKFK